MMVFNYTQTRKHLSCGFVIAVLGTFGYIPAVLTLVAGLLLKMQPFLLIALMTATPILLMFAIFVVQVDYKIDAARRGRHLSPNIQRTIDGFRFWFPLVILVAVVALIAVCVVCSFYQSDFRYVTYLPFVIIWLLLWLLTCAQVCFCYEQSQSQSRETCAIVLLFIPQLFLVLGTFYLFFLHHPQLMAILVMHLVLVWKYWQYLTLIRDKWHLAKEEAEKCQQKRAIAAGPLALISPFVEIYISKQ